MESETSSPKALAPMHLPRTSRLILALLMAAAALAAASPASAHKQGMRLALGPVVGTASPVALRTSGVLLLEPLGGGRMSLDLRGLRTSSGAKLQAPGNLLRLALRVNGVPASYSFPFDIRDGASSLHATITPGQGLFKGDRVEVVAVDLLDQDGVRFGTIGVPPGTRTPILSSALVYVIDSTSPIRFSRGGDTRLKLRDDGNFNSGFDTLLDPTGKEITSPGVTVELQVVRNGTPQLYSYSYDIVHGRSVPDGRPVVQLGFLITDTIEVQRLDVFDDTHERFATLGLKINAPARKP